MTTTDQSINSNVNIDFKPAHYKGEKRENSSRSKPSYTNRHKSSHDPKMNSEKYVAHRYQEQVAHNVKIKPGEEPVRIGSLLGLEQVGQCIFIEYKDDIILVDAGMEFAANETMGADYIIPDIAYIKKNIKKFKGVFLTHGHLDHIGALRDILPELDFPMVYTTPLTLGLVKKSFDDIKMAQKIKYKIVDPDVDIIKVGSFMVEFVRVNHNIPETFALSITTPKGVLFTSADFKIDHTPAIDLPADLAKIARIGTEGVKLYIGDSLGSNRPGFAISEKVIGQNLDKVIRDAKGRLVISTFASNVGRVIQIIESAARLGKVVFLSGRSMIGYTEVAAELGYIRVPDGVIRKIESGEINTMPDEKIIVLSTGAQGEEFSALARMSRDEFQYFQLKPGDTVLTSSSAIPGNEKQMAKMINALVTKGVNMITLDDMDIHASGHGGAEDHKIMLGLLKPQFFLPFYTEASLRYRHRALAMDMGMPSDRIMMPSTNGSILEIYDDGVVISDKSLKLNTVLIDGKGKGHLSGEYVIKARQIMADAGMVSLIFKIDNQNKELVGNIQIESRGFVYSSEVKDIHTSIVEFARKKYNDNKGKNRPVADILKMIKEDLGGYINKIIGRSPMIIIGYVYISRDAFKEEFSSEDAIVGSTLEEQGGDS
ncbi:Ribonuclease J 1 [candidate division SR1 bacterium Aalborg_AAW-1]|nr:Ribonuclease J 1 [candidate division SR1 bacterium Aalborg_AAW-1]